MFVKKFYLCILLSCFTILNLHAEDANFNKIIVGKWHGVREQSTKCQFLAWNSNFTKDGQFEITFFADKEKKIALQTEKGTWKASNGQQELITEGVSMPEIYAYSIIDNNTIKYVNIKSDPSADCQEDYQFTEHRVE